MNPSRYKKRYAEDILAYFRSFLGYWERRLEAAEQRLAANAWQERAEEIARRQQEAFEQGKPFNEDVGALLDPESIKQGARVRAYENILSEMTAKRRLQGLPEFVKWATRIGVTTQTVRNWREEHEEFDAACRECEEIQKVLIKDGGLSGIYAGKTATFLLQAVHGMRAEPEDKEDAAERLVVNLERITPKKEAGDGETTDE